MGLDQYAISIKEEAYELYLKSIRGDELDYDVTKTIDACTKELMTWRKHANLNKFMEDLWIAKGNTGTFNCEQLELTIQDINKLEELVVNNELPHGVGFFWGESSDDDKVQDLEFIKKAKEALNNGESVYYSCWW